MFTLDMLEVLLPPPSFCAAREHSIACISMAFPHIPPLPLPPCARSPTRQVLWKIVCLFPCFHFSSFVSFWFFFSFIFCCSCVCVVFLCFSPISLPVYLHSRSFLLSLPCCRLDFGFGFSTSISISFGFGSAAAQLQLAPLTWPHSAHDCVGRLVVCFILFAFVYK